MKLDVSERIRLLGILPEKGNLLTLKIVRTLHDDLSFSEKELKDWKIVTTNDRITWGHNAKEKEVEIGDQAKEIIVKTLKEMDEKEQLTIPDIRLWDKFVGEK
jgi:hypothetical protein